MTVRLNFRIQAVSTERTDLVCILCGQFRTEFAIVPPAGSDENAQTGIHKRCVAACKVCRMGRSALDNNA